MVWHVRGDTLGQQAYTVTGLIQLLSNPHPPAAISFPMLSNTNATSLGVGQAANLTLGVAAQTVRSIGLITCASVIWLSQAGDAHVYHANAGALSQTTFNAAMAALGHPNPATVYCVFAHPGNTDPGYAGSLASLVTWGMATGNIVEVTNLLVSQFGINNLGQVGF